MDVVIYECRSIKCRHVDAAVPPVAVAHDMSYLVADLRSRIDHTRSHQSREIGLDLEIDVVGMRVVFPMAARGSGNPVENVVACRLIGVPQFIARIGEGIGQGIHRHVEIVFVKDLDKRKVHVNIVVETAFIFVVPFAVTVGPYDLHAVGDGEIIPAEV